MVKVWGTIFTIAGSFILLLTYFFYRNSSAYLKYNNPTHVSLLDVNLLLPMVLGVVLGAIGVVLLATSKDKSYSAHDH